jgi:hypothetical protein
MPRKIRNNKRKGRKIRPKRNRKRNRFNQGASTAIERSLMADTTLVNMTWSFIDGAPYTGAGELFFSGNSIFDPGIGISAGQNPVGYVQWENFYSKYRVLSSSVSMRNMAADSSDTAAYVTIFPSNNNVGVANSIDAQGQPYVKKSFFNIQSGNSKASMVNFMKTSKIFGQKSIMNDDAYAANFGAVPTNEWFWIFNIYDPSGSASNGYLYDVRITYQVLLFDRRPLVQGNTILGIDEMKIQTVEPKSDWSIWRKNKYEQQVKLHDKWAAQVQRHRYKILNE